MEKFIKKTGEYFGFKGNYEPAPTYPGSVDRRCPDISKAKLDLNYTPTFHWKEAVKLTVNWFNQLDSPKQYHL